MLLADLTPELLMCQLWHDYLALSHEDYMALTQSEVTEDTAALDIPDTLTRHVMRTVEIPDPPAMIVSATEDDDSRGRRRVIITSIMLRGWLKGDSAPASTLMTTREGMAAIIRAAQRRVMNDAAFQAWLDTLADERKAGWRIMKTIHGRVVKPMINEQVGTLMQGFAIRQIVLMDLDVIPEF